MPNFESLSTKVHETFPNEALRHLRPPESLHLLTEDSLEHAFDQVGFEPMAGWYFGLDFYELVTHLSMNYDGFYESPVYKFLIDNLDEQKQNDHMLVVARRQ